MSWRKKDGEKRSSWWGVLWVSLGLLLTAVLVVVVLFVVNRFSVEIRMNGESEMTIEYQQGYTDAGAEAYLVGTLFLKDGYPLEMSTKNSVNPDELGAYTVEYSADLWRYETTAQRTVAVVDTQRPVIKLVSSPDVYTLPGTAYEEEGFTASDNHDGDITSKVERYEKDGYVYYKVKDSSGNSAVIGREIHYNDPIPPELTLEGDSEITLSAGSRYEEPGYTAVDNCDGDMTDKVSVTGSVDIYRSGTYTLEYSVTDSYGNTDTATRTVYVVPRPQPDTVTPSGKVVYLTFDDGPGGYTDRLLEILAKYNAKATFFVVNTGSIDKVSSIAAAGHAIGIHSMTHDYDAIYASEDAFFADLLGMQKIIKDYTGIETTLMRFPGGSSNTVSDFNPGIMTRLTQAVEDMGFQYFDWNVSSDDAYNAYDSETVYQRVIDGISGRNVSVVLQHDIKGYSVEAVEKILAWGIANGYTFQSLNSSSPTAHHGVNN